MISTYWIWPAVFILSACLNSPDDSAIGAGSQGRDPSAQSSGASGVSDPGKPGALTNVALQGVATASAVWENNPMFVAAHAIDGSTHDGGQAGNYWLLPNEMPGWLEIDLNKNHQIRSIVLLNTNNSIANDRATKDFRLEIRNAKGKVVHSASGVLPFTSMSSAINLTTPFTFKFKKAIRGRYVKIYVDSWYPTRRDPSWPYPTIPSSDLANQGGGLNEVMVFARAGCR